MASHLTLEERDRIAQLRHQGADQKEIAQAVERCRSTISRELRRNRADDEYHAAQAQREAERRRRERPLVRKMENPEINEAVRAGLAHEWAPEQIARRMRQQGCHRLAKHLGMELYFADPGCPHQRGTNENTNGLIRPYFPKGTDFRDISHDEVRQVEELLNNRPRACLNFRTPAEVFFEENPHSGCDCD